MPAPAPLPEPAGAGEPPAVNIHIGRIEVRTVTPERPPAVAPAATTFVALDDYLRGQRRGRS